MKWRDKKFTSLRRSENQNDRNRINLRVKIERVTKKENFLLSSDLQRRFYKSASEICRRRL